MAFIKLGATLMNAADIERVVLLEGNLKLEVRFRGGGFTQAAFSDEEVAIRTFEDIFARLNKQELFLKLDDLVVRASDVVSLFQIGSEITVATRDGTNHRLTFFQMDVATRELLAFQKLLNEDILSCIYSVPTGQSQ